MKIIYEAHKGKRIKKGTLRYLNGYRCPIFSLECTDEDDNILWWFEDTKQWRTTLSKKGGWNGICSSCNDNIHSLKATIRHIKKHNYLPKGTKFILKSLYVGYDITIKL